MKELDAEEIQRARWEHMGRWLSLAFRHYEEAVVRRMHDHGFPDIRLVHVSLFRCMDTEGTRLTEIAERASMHKQAIGQLVKECERTGYVERRPDPHDGRAQQICFTEKGRRLLKVMKEVHQASERDFIDIVGPELMAPFKEALHRIAIVQRQSERARDSAPEASEGVRRRRGRPPKSERQTSEAS